MPATLTPAPASRGVKQRAQALAPYLRQLLDPTAGPGAASPIVFELRGDPWIRSQIAPSQATGGEEANGIQELVAHSCAFLAKCHADMESLNATDPRNKNALYTLQAELMLDAAIGTALLREFQPAIDASVKAGDMVQAKGFSQIGHRVRKVVTSAKQVISDAGRSDADKLADAMTEQPREKGVKSGALDQVVREIGEDYDRRKRTARIRDKVLSQVRLPSRREMLVVTLACCFFFWVGTVKIPEVLDRRPSLIDREDFSEALVLEVEARPPSLYVTLDASAWDAADAVARESIVKEVASVPLVDDDYRGALIRTTDGRPVAVWLRSSGIRMLETVEPIARPDEPQRANIFVP